MPNPSLNADNDTGFMEDYVKKRKKALRRVKCEKNLG